MLAGSQEGGTKGNFFKGREEGTARMRSTFCFLVSFAPYSSFRVLGSLASVQASSNCAGFGGPFPFFR